MTVIETAEAKKEHYLYPGQIFASKEEYVVTTVLGSCVSVCLWDPVTRTGGINHYMLALWNGDGLASPKYGNIAIAKLIEKMLALGCRKENLKAKVFGGGAVLQGASGLMNVGERNIMLARSALEEAKIPILTSHLGDTFGRKIIYNTSSGEVLMKKVIPGSSHTKG